MSGVERVSGSESQQLALELEEADGLDLGAWVESLPLMPDGPPAAGCEEGDRAA